ncbi:hypothetical protein EYS42_15255 [Aquabacterium lacunae]|uniref:Uncharacterized protein n=1 Tax=Aquabacterium lacunae TaxID=2528630 RepID=A0A4Q9H1L7_9BURK|nr:hypothetical protein [Aquabacterium lacunae]TBO28361.1 hypothetical protein EYS42_15255 [Aquabacterium lacunae]
MIRPTLPRRPAAAPLSWGWLMLLGLGGLLVAVVVLTSALALAPRPDWVWVAGQGPHVETPNGRLRIAALDVGGKRHPTHAGWHPPSLDTQRTPQARQLSVEVEQLLARVEGRPDLAFIDDDGARWPLRWEAQGLPGLPWQMGLMLLTALMVWQVAVRHWQARAEHPQHRLHGLIGLALSLDLIVRAWPLARPWAWPSGGLELSLLASQAFTTAYLGGTLLWFMRWLNPRVPGWATVALLGVVGVLGLSVMLQLSPSYHWWILTMPLGTVGLLVGIGTLMAWARASEDSSMRQGLRWFFASLALAAIVPGTILALQPAELAGAGFDNLIRCAVALPYVGMMALLDTQRLRHLEVLSWRAWTWLLALLGSFCFVVSLLWLGGPWSSPVLVASSLSLPWFYLLARSWLMPTEQRDPGERLESLLPGLLDLGKLGRGPDGQERWLMALDRAFHPRHLIVEGRDEGPERRVQMERGGRTLRVPALGQGWVRLEGAQGGSRLFNDHDKLLAQTLWQLASQSADFGSGRMGLTDSEGRFVP